jgi:rubrerythrin
VVELLVARHGPEVLADCYPDGSANLSEDVIQRAAVSCPGCGYLLLGLPATGLCPECGKSYSKRQLLWGE